MTALPQASASPDARDVARTNLFLAATLAFAAIGTVVVKVRNLSATGAMVEAGVLPPPGTSVSLTRGSLRIDGRVVWATDKRCGIAFQGTVSVRQWMAPARSQEQERVDQAVAAYRSGSLVASGRRSEPRSLPEHLLLACRLLEQLGDALCSDPDVILRHTTDLQKLDIAGQLLAATIGALRSGPDSLQRLADLKASAEQALRPTGH